jgi:hypothetical protein
MLRALASRSPAATAYRALRGQGPMNRWRRSGPTVGDAAQGRRTLLGVLIRQTRIGHRLLTEVAPSRVSVVHERPRFVDRLKRYSFADTQSIV